MRNATLLTMGFKSYREYLESSLWATIRERVYRKCGRQCTLCEYQAEVLHHIGYSKETLLGSDLKSIVPLCRSCHEKVEFDGNGKKRTFVGAHTAYVRLLKKTKKIPGTNPVANKCKYCGSQAKKGERTCRACNTVHARRARRNERRKALGISKRGFWRCCGIAWVQGESTCPRCKPGD